MKMIGRKSRLRKMEQSIKRFIIYSITFFLFYYILSSWFVQKEKEMDDTQDQEPPDYYAGFLSDTNTLNINQLNCNNSNHIITRRESAVYTSNGTEYLYNSNETPILFIGGYPRSGSEIIVDLVKRHTELECMSETFMFTGALELYFRWKKSEVESHRLNEAHVTAQVLRDAFSALLLELIVKPGRPGRSKFCIHEPLIYKYAPYVHLIFPNSKFLYIVRDGRAVIHSLIVEQHYKKSLRFDNHMKGFEKWRDETTELIFKCGKLGSERCLILKYEDLLVYPRASIKTLFRFLGVNVTVTTKDGEITRNDKIANEDGLKFLLKRQLHLGKEDRKDSQILFELLDKLGYDPYDKELRNLYGANYNLIGSIGVNVSVDFYE